MIVEKKKSDSTLWVKATRAALKFADSKKSLNYNWKLSTRWREDWKKRSKLQQKQI